MESYNKLDKPKVNMNINNINQFIKKQVDYNKIIGLNDNKFFGVTTKNYLDKKTNKKDEYIEIYNIKNQMVETKIKTNYPYDIFFNEKYNLIILNHENCLEIFNFRDFTLIQKIEINEKQKGGKRQTSSLWNKKDDNREINNEFIHVEFINENNVGIIYQGNLSFLGDEVINLCHFDNIKVINFENQYGDDDNYNLYSYLIIYQRDKRNSSFIPKDIKLLVKMDIAICEVPFTSGEFDIDNENDDTYCSFKFDNITRISEEEYIISFRSKLEAKKDQGYFIITDEFYDNETIYYYLNLKKDSSINEVVVSTDEKSYLFKNDIDDKFYFIYKNSNKFVTDLENYFKKKDLDLITIDVDNKLNIRNLYIENHNIIGWNNDSMYVGKIISGELEIINDFTFEENEDIKFISLKNRSIYYKGEKNKNEDSIIEDNDNNSDNSDNSDNLARIINEDNSEED